MNTEDKILEAAQEEFLVRGYDGARMRSISDAADINKGLLHYYFKSKEALMLNVFNRLFRQIFQDLTDIFNSDISIVEKIEKAVDSYLEFLIKNPRIPFFIVSELNRDMKAHLKRMHDADVSPPFRELSRQLEEAKKTGEIRKDFSTRQFMLNFMSLMLFPFVAKEMIMFAHQMDEKDFSSILRDRKNYVTNLLIKDLKD